MNINEYINLYFENKIINISDVDKNYKFIGMYYTIIENKKKYMIWDVIDKSNCYFDNTSLKTTQNNKDLVLLKYLIYKIIYSDNIILNIKMELYFILGLFFSLYKTDTIYMIKKDKKKFYFVKK